MAQMDKHTHTSFSVGKNIYIINTLNQTRQRNNTFFSPPPPLVLLWSAGVDPSQRTHGPFNIIIVVMIDIANTERMFTSRREEGGGGTPQWNEEGGIESALWDVK